MILEVVVYGHPALNAQGSKVRKIDDRIRQLAADMIETMHAYQGVGLAAQQVGLPLQMFVLEVLQWEESPSIMWKDGQSVPFEHLMPMVLINPQIEIEGEILSEGEGCLSFPGVYGNVERPARVHLRAHNLENERIEFSAEGLLARAIQHEFDHLQGILFTKRMNPQTLKELYPIISSLNPNDLSLPSEHEVTDQNRSENTHDVCNEASR